MATTQSTPKDGNSAGFVRKLAFQAQGTDKPQSVLGPSTCISPIGHPPCRAANERLISDVASLGAKQTAPEVPDERTERAAVGMHRQQGTKDESLTTVPLCRAP